MTDLDLSIVAGGVSSFPQAPALLPALFDYFATFLWALSGALLAARRGYTGMGVFVIATVSVTGGGILRDGLRLSRIPEALQDPIYVTLAFLAAAATMAVGRHVDQFKMMDTAVHFVVALGAGVYAVVRVNHAIAAGLPFTGIVIVGVVNAIGGGLLRDVVMRRVPDLLKPGLPFAIAPLVGAGLFAILVRPLAVEPIAAALSTTGSIFVLNLIVIRLNVRSRPWAGFREYWEGRE